MHAVIALAALAVLAWYWRQVSRDERKQHMATEELLNRPLSFYTAHVNEKPATGDAVTGRENRIADSAATTNRNAVPRN